MLATGEKQALPLSDDHKPERASERERVEAAGGACLVVLHVSVRLGMRKGRGRGGGGGGGGGSWCTRRQQVIRAFLSLHLSSSVSSSLSSFVSPSSSVPSCSRRHYCHPCACSDGANVALAAPLITTPLPPDTTLRAAGMVLKYGSCWRVTTPEALEWERLPPFKQKAVARPVQPAVARSFGDITLKV